MTIAVIAGSSRALWQRKVARQMQGRVFAILEMVSKSASPLAILAERLFNPLMASGGALASSIGSVIGAGPGRGIALMFVMMGLIQTVVAAAGGYTGPCGQLRMNSRMPFDRSVLAKQPNLITPSQFECTIKSAQYNPHTMKISFASL